MNYFVLADRELSEFTNVCSVHEQGVLLDLVNQLSKRFYDTQLHEEKRDIQVQVNTCVDLGSKRSRTERLVYEV